VAGGNYPASHFCKNGMLPTIKKYKIALQLPAKKTENSYGIRSKEN
jgi:hypothetical protein